MSNVPVTSGPQASVDRRIAALATRQHGVFARTQAIQLGATKPLIGRRLRHGIWEVPLRGVYRLAGTHATWDQALMAACLGWGSNASISHRAAAALEGLAGLESRLVELSVPRGRRRTHRDHIVHWTNSIARADLTTVRGIPVTTPSRTLLDIAALVSSDVLEEALDDALRKRMTSLSRMRWQLAQASRNTQGIGSLRALLDARDPSTAVPESVFETKLARILRRGRVRGLVAQHQIRVSGRLLARVDFAIPDARVAIEAEGYRWHSSRTNWEHDLARRNALTNLGWRVIHVTWTDLERPEAILRNIEQALSESRA